MKVDQAIQRTKNEMDNEWTEKESEFYLAKIVRHMWDVRTHYNKKGGSDGQNP